MALSPDTVARAVALIEAGFTTSGVAQRLGVSASTVKRIKSRHGATKGVATAELVESARQELALAFDAEWIRRQTAAFVHDEISQAHALREQIQAALADAPSPEDAKSWGILMRGLTAAATAMKATSDQLNRTLGCESREEASSLPELVITVIEPEQVKVMQEMHARALEDSLAFEDSDSDDQEIVETQ